MVVWISDYITGARNNMFNWLRISVLMSLAAVATGGLVGCAEAPVKKDYSNLVWPLPPDKPRIKYLASYSGQVDFDSDSAKASLFGAENGGLGLMKPYGVATNKDGSRIYVTDTKMAMLLVFDLKARKVEPLQTDAHGGLNNPVEVRLDSRDRIYVTDSGRKEVIIYAPDGKTVRSFGKSEKLERPSGLALDEARNRLYVSDTPSHRILMYDLEGNFQKVLVSERGSDPGQINYPINLVVDKSGNLLETDTGNFRVQVFAPDGQLVKTFGQLGDAVGSFSRPKGVALDSDGNIYVVDAAFNNFQIFNAEGQTLLFVGAMGREPGMFWLPAGIYIDSADRIYVVDSINARVQVFQYLKEQKEVVDEAKKQ